MKIRIILIALLLPMLSFGQNYRPFLNGRDQVFKYTNPYFGAASGDTDYHILHVDTMFLSGTDTVFRTPAAFLNDFSIYYSECFGHDTSFIAQESRITSMNDFFLYNQYNENILIKLNAPLGSIWTMYTFPDGRYLEATVTSITPENVLGIPDTVKNISLQAKDAGGLPIPHLFNGKNVRIGKNTGLIEMFSNHFFPVEAVMFTLVGFSGPVLGTTNLTVEQVYDFNVGDDFHWYGEDDAITSDHYEWEQKTVISKMVSVTGDTITYTFERRYKVTNTYYTPPPGTTSSTYTHDTITETYVLSDTSVINYLPFESILDVNTLNGFCRQFNNASYNGRMKKRMDLNYWHWDSCATQYVASCNWYETYAAGLGKIIDQCSGLPNYDESMVYYKKGAQVWGTPLNWSAILGYDEPGKDLPVVVYPNPFSEYTTVYTGKKEIRHGRLLVSDISGRIVLTRKEISGKEIRINRGNLDAGQYQFILFDGNEKIKSGKLVIQ